MTNITVLSTDEEILQNRFRQKIVGEIQALNRAEIVRKFKTGGIDALSINEIALYDKVYRPESKRLLEKLQLWDTVHGRNWWVKA